MDKYNEKKDKYTTATTIPIGDIVEAGTASTFCTGNWRSRKPIWNNTKCINCLICWIYCPDSSIKLISKSNKTIVSGINYTYCKGCGICANVCNIKAIVMEEENK
ncbi:MAG: 4Fe-4S binding protein [Endomicrobium sp.]|nr:4Fe-4S binding protein [Endomicrobium sp.]